MTPTTDSEFLDAVGKLAHAVKGWLNDTSGSDSEYVIALQACVDEVAENVAPLRKRADTNKL
jgi:hypothetical protein